MSPEDSLPTWWTNKLAVTSNSMNKMRDYLLVPSVSEEVELDEKVKEYKGVAYFKTRKDAEKHMKKFAPKGRVVEYERGYAVQTRISGPYLNKSGKTEEVELDEKKTIPSILMPMSVEREIEKMMKDRKYKGKTSAFEAAVKKKTLIIDSPVKTSSSEDKEIPIIAANA